MNECDGRGTTVNLLSKYECGHSGTTVNLLNDECEHGRMAVSWTNMNVSIVEPQCIC